MSCSNSKSNSPKGCETNFEDEPVECTTKIPDTYKFSCPAGEDCDKNNNKPTPLPQVRVMPKSECSACCGSQEKATESQTECTSPKKAFMEDNPPAVTTKLPSTKSFKFPENCDEGKKESKECKGEQKDASSGNCKEKKPEEKKSCTSCGAPVPGKPCICNKPIAPVPKQPPCGCSGKGSNCEANTECATTPLSMKRK